VVLKPWNIDRGRAHDVSDKEEDGEEDTSDGEISEATFLKMNPVGGALPSGDEQMPPVEKA
jgi:hypothetical protein